MTCCANAAQISSKVVINVLDVCGSDGHVLVFLHLALSGHTSQFFEALDDEVESALMSGS